MPVGPNPLAIKAVSFVHATKVEITAELTELDPLLNKDDEFVAGAAIDRINTLSVEGKGDLPAALVAGSVGGIAITGITGGKTIVESSKETEHTDKWNEWSATAKNFPAAS